ncbi:Hypothetical protein PHPALM_11539 [Phytophthora palmivora]|uniref:Uncharacterized protein n=1 Tax=Phytophthora palmivora TaxID=4796 RepID=A0A2P4Y1Z3_9STRA|nr:Hypothetical protein PHPALM_11539 [Phytophthora palmivora]
MLHAFTQVEDGLYKCTTCGKQYKNLNRNHESCEQELKSLPLGLHLVCQQTIWIYIAGLIGPFAATFRLYLQNGGSPALLSFCRTSQRMLCRVDLRGFCELPDLFILVLDLWANGNRHYIAIFAVLWAVYQW